MLELAVGAFLAVDGEPGRSKILEEVADFLRHGDGCFAPSGLCLFGGAEPGAMPRAGMFRPVGALDLGCGKKGAGSSLLLIGRPRTRRRSSWHQLSTPFFPLP